MELNPNLDTQEAEAGGFQASLGYKQHLVPKQ